MEPGVATLLEGWLIHPLVGRLLVLLAGLVATLIAAGLLRRAVARYVQDDSMRYRARKLVSALGYLVAALFATIVFADRLGGLTVAFGVAGAGVAFALQEVIASVAGWLGISFGQIYKVGDRVRLGEITGDVIDVALLRTTIMEIGGWVDADQYNGRIVRVSNDAIFKGPVFNYSGEFPFLWDEIRIPIKYGSDYHEARAIIERVADEVSGAYARDAEAAWAPIKRRYLVEAASVKHAVTLSANENWIEFTLRYVVEFKRRRSTKDRLFTRILEEIDRTGERVGIAAATLNIEKLPPLDLRVDRPG